MKQRKSYKKTVIIAVLTLAVILAGALAGCSKAVYNEDYALPDTYYDGDTGLSGDVDEAPAQSAETAPSVSTAQKLIKRAQITGETRSFDKMISDLEQALKDAGGYYETFSVSENERGSDARVLEMVARIPAENLDAYLGRAGEAFSVYSKRESVTDVASEYYDTKARMETMIAKRDALQNMMASAANVSELLEIQERLYDAIADIEAMQARLNLLDSLVSYSTVNVTVYEVVEYTQKGEQSFGARIKQSFKDGWKDFRDGWADFAVWFVGALPGLIVFAAIVVAIVLIIRHAVKKSRKRKMMQNQQYQQILSPDGEKTAK